MTLNTKDMNEDFSKKALLIIDPQVDFITGTLAVPDAVTKMHNLRRRLEYGNYNWIIVTLDWHPKTHCSFKENGGEWPTHCVGFSEGSIPYPPLYNKIIEKEANSIIVMKGEDPEKEEYGAFKKENLSPSGEEIINILQNQIDKIEVAGIMSEYCVKETIKNLTEDYDGIKEKLNVLLPCIATMDNNLTLLSYLKEKGIKYTGE